MRLATHDRGEVLSFAGFHHLSPALRDGAPRLVVAADNAGRVGWEPFFAALDAAGLVMAWDTEDPASALPISADEGRAMERIPTHASMDDALRFVRAFRRGPTAPGSS
jgi:hypothetical protein